MIYIYEIDLRKLSPEQLGLSNVPKFNPNDTIILTGNIKNNIDPSSEDVLIDYNVNHHFKWTPEVCRTFLADCAVNTIEDVIKKWKIKDKESLYRRKCYAKNKLSTGKGRR